MRIRDMRRLSGPPLYRDGPTHLARYEVAHLEAARHVLDVACPDCATSPGMPCVSLATAASRIEGPA